MNHIATIALFLIAMSSYGQPSFDQSKISSKTARIVSKIEQVNELMGSAVYYAGIRPQQYNNFQLLEKTASKEELIALTNHPNGVVRCYSFWALSHDHSNDLWPIVRKHINDEELVKTQFGCVGGREKVGDFFINVAHPKYIDLSSKKLSASQLAALDSLLIFVPNDLYAKSRTVSSVKITKGIYPRIRELVMKDKDQQALVTLAKYQKDQDIALIIEDHDSSERNDDLFYNWQAISYFPHPGFFPLLERDLKGTLNSTHYGNEWSKLYEAIASYKSAKAIELLKVPFTQVKHNDIRPYHIGFVFSALRRFRDPIYDDLLWSLWADEKQIDITIFKYLSGKDPERAFALIKKSLADMEGTYVAEISYNEEGDIVSSENLSMIMFDEVLRRDRKLALEIIHKNIKEGNVHQFLLFADEAGEIRDRSFVEPLFKRLETDDNPHVYLKAAEVLLLFKDKEINKRIETARTKNEHLKKDWGGEAFAKMLKENSLKIQ